MSLLDIDVFAALTMQSLPSSSTLKVRCSWMYLQASLQHHTHTHTHTHKLPKQTTLHPPIFKLTYDLQFSALSRIPNQQFSMR